MNIKAISQEITQLPPEGQREVLHFVAFLQSRFKTEGSTPIKRSITDAPFIGMWKNRDDMADSGAWVRGVRQKEWTGK